MISYRYVISNSQGLHASNSMSLSRAASDYQSQITMTSSKGDANCKNVLALMSLNARQGETVVLNVDGPDEKQAAGFLNGLLRTILQYHNHKQKKRPEFVFRDRVSVYAAIKGTLAARTAANGKEQSPYDYKKYISNYI